MEKLTCQRAKQIDLVEYLASLGFHPDLKKSRSNEFWYLSPFRNEKTPSFKVDRNRNIWYDHGEGVGGNLVDFGIRYFQCGVKEFLNKLSFPALNLSVYKAQNNQSIPNANSRIIVVSAGPIISPALIQYLRLRRIPVDLANKYCSEVRYQIYGKEYYAIGFKNTSGGYELRNSKFKGSTSPKDYTYIDNKCDEISVFEGFFSFLSFLVLKQNFNEHHTNYLILNSLSLFVRSMPVLNKHQRVNMYLDNDDQGKKYLKKGTDSGEKFKDCSALYQGYKDLNEYLIHMNNAIRLHRIEERTYARGFQRGL